MQRSSAIYLSAATVVALAGCGSDGGDAGTLRDQEYLGHQLRDVADGDAPSLDFDIEPDDHGGWNIRINADGFEFTPEEVSGDAVGGQGHAHVYVDDTKFSRIYSEYFYLPASAVPEGEHTVMITLNADDHSVWANGGEPVAATAAVTGEAGDDHGDHSHGHDTDETDESGEADATEQADHVFTYTIADGVAEPPLEQHTVDQGSTVRIEVTSDVADELHMHGYDVETEMTPGEVAVLEFTADMTGRFALETHEAGLMLLDLLVE
jgi:hypothetical protein